MQRITGAADSILALAVHWAVAVHWNLRRAHGDLCVVASEASAMGIGVGEQAP
jgi:hypothetical protein